MPSKKNTAKVLGAKKEVTKSDAKKLKPLTRYWKNRLNSDNLNVFGMGIVTGGCIVFIIYTLLRSV